MKKIKELIISKQTIGEEHPPFIVAELSANHHHSLDYALKMVEAAKKSGAHAIKLQTYTPDTLTLDRRDEEFIIQDQHSLWKGKNFYDLYSEAYMPWDFHAPIFKKCLELGISCFSTPFDETAIDFLEELETPCYKIASLEIIDLPLIRKAASTGKPLIISTGAATLSEIDEAVTTARGAGCDEIILLKCTSAYPASSLEAHLRTLPHLSASFDLPVGLSDHTPGIGAAIASIAFGAVMIEKHFTLSRSDGGSDAQFSIEPIELEQLTIESKRAWQALGRIHYGPELSERECHTYRPSLYFICDLPEGKIISAEHIRSVRPSKGLPPKEADRIIGLTLNQGVKNGTPVSWNHFRNSI